MYFRFSENGFETLFLPQIHHLTVILCTMFYNPILLPVNQTLYSCNLLTTLKVFGVHSDEILFLEHDRLIQRLLPLWLFLVHDLDAYNDWNDLHIYSSNVYGNEYH